MRIGSQTFLFDILQAYRHRSICEPMPLRLGTGIFGNFPGPNGNLYGRAFTNCGYTLFQMSLDGSSLQLPSSCFGSLTPIFATDGKPYLSSAYVGQGAIYELSSTDGSLINSVQLGEAEVPTI